MTVVPGGLAGAPWRSGCSAGTRRPTPNWRPPSAVETSDADHGVTGLDASRYGTLLSDRLVGQLEARICAPHGALVTELLGALETLSGAARAAGPHAS